MLRSTVGSEGVVGREETDRVTGDKIQAQAWQYRGRATIGWRLYFPLSRVYVSQVEPTGLCYMNANRVLHPGPTAPPPPARSSTACSSPASPEAD